MLRMHRGDSAVFELAVATPPATYGATPVPVDLTGASARFTAKRRLADLDAAAVIAKASPAGVVITDGPGGLLEVRLAAEDTDGLEAPVTLHYDVQVRDVAGQVRTVDAGYLVIRPDVTQAST